jgi:predicted metal-dependent enzyme (double-stranded beta helix superfamily)
MFAVPPNTVAAPANRAIAHPVRIARELAADRHNWAHLLRYDPEQRWFGLLERTDEHEAWLLSWLPGQHTELHDHGGATGAFTIVSGTLTERAIQTRADGRPAEALHSLVAGQSRVFGPDYVHQVYNDDPDPAVSIHVYRPARARMTLYTVDPTKGLTRS